MKTPTAFDPAVHNAADFCGLTAGEREALAEAGYSFEALKVVTFHDTKENAPWWARSSSLVGYVFAVVDGSKPADPAYVLKSAREAFGSDVSVLWC